MKLQTDSKKQQRVWVCAIIVAGIAINWMGAKIATATGCPLYLDSIGTVLVSALTGYLAGIYVACFSNLLAGLSDETAAYYAFISVLLAITTVRLSHKGFLHSWKKVPVTVAVLALIGGGLGSILTWFLYDLKIGEEKSAELAKILFSQYNLGAFWSELAADLWIDWWDKCVVVLLAVTVMNVLPQRITSWLERFDNQRTDGLVHAHSRHSLCAAIVRVVAVSCFLIGVVAVCLSYWFYAEVRSSSCVQMAMGVANLLRQELPADKLQGYLQSRQKDHDYYRTVRNMQKLRQAFIDVKYLYVYYVKDDMVHVIFDLDTPDTPAGELGESFPIEEDFLMYKDLLQRGEWIPRIETNGRFGALLTSYLPVYDSTGNYVAYACADISKGHVLASSLQHFVRMFALLFAIVSVLGITVITWLKRNLVYPLNTMTEAANHFVNNDTMTHLEALAGLKQLQIKTGNELEKLYNSIVATADELTQHENDMLLILDNINSPLGLFNKGGKLLLANKAWQALAQKVPDELETLYDMMMYDKDDTGRPCSLMRNLGERDFHITARRVRQTDGTVAAVVIACNDITEIRHAEARMKEALEKESDMTYRKNLFLSSIGHEIRTPLNAIVGYSALLKDEHDRGDKISDYATAIQASANNVSRLVETLATLLPQEEVKTEALQVSSCDLRSMIKDIVQRIGSCFQEKGNTVTVKIDDRLPREMLLNGSGMSNIIYHLFHNACKYTDHGSITIAVKWLATDETFELSCCDTGIGIPAKELDNVFEVFFQVDVQRDEHEYKGKGLGLAFVKQMVHNMGGTIRVDSVEGKGSCFTIVIPHVKAVAELMPATAVTVEEFAAGITALVLDDIALNVKVLCAICKRIKLKTIGTTDIQAALTAVGNHEIQLILTDVWMPVMNGIEFAKKVRAMPGMESLPIYAVTADAAVDKNFDTSVLTGVMQKPITVEHVKAILQTMMSSQR